MLKRINKTQARKLYNHDANIIIIPCKMYPNPGGGFDMASYMNKAQLAAIYELPIDDKELDFDTRVRNFEWYNCNYETGYYSHFYIME